MKNILKNKVVTVVILIATLLLAGIAVFTAMRLYQLRQEAVAPNAPSSEPAAATPANVCQELVFTVSSPPPGTCAYIISPTTISMRPGEVRPVNIRISGDPGTANGHRVVVTSRSTTVATVAPGTCSGFGPCTDEIYSITARAVGTTVIDIKSPNNRTGSTSPLCTAVVNVTVSAGLVTEPPTAPPTTPPGTTPPGTTPPATAGPTATPISCNNTCTTTSDCQSDLVCSAGKCRHPNCTGETDCNCSVATATPTVPPAGTNPPATDTTLPATGFNLPTILGGGLGILVILGALLLLI